MPYPKQHVRLTYQFAIAGTDEIADTGIKISNPTGSFDAVAWLASVTDTQLQNFAGYLHVAMTAAGTILWASYSHFVSIKAAAVDVNGHYMIGPKLSAIASLAGTDSGVLPQATVVASLRSADTFGTANFGRMYLPHTSFAVGTSYQAPTANATNTAVAMRTFVDSTNIQSDIVLAGSRVVNMSRIGAGSVKPIARVGVGRLVDTQRRRRNALEEGYVFSAL